MTLTIRSLVATAIVLIASQSFAQIYNESGDATDLPGGQSVTDGTTTILGTNGGIDPDLYAFSWGGGVLTMDAGGTNDFDPQLHLFESDGTGIAENDDGADGANVCGGFNCSEISLDLPGGVYLLAMTEFNNDALDAGGNPIFGFTNTFNDLNGNFIQGPEGNGPLAGWDGLGNGVGGAYTINFSSPVNAVPEPAGFGLLLLGMAALLRVRRK